MSGWTMPGLSNSSDPAACGNDLSAGLDSKNGMGLGAGCTDFQRRRMFKRYMSAHRLYEMKSESTTSAEGVPAARLPNRAGRGSSTLTSALSIRFETIDLQTALYLNGLWHSRLPQLDRRVAAWLCYGAKCEDSYLAAAVWSLPVARLLPQDGSCLELRRFALGPTTPTNTASRMLGWMVRDIARRRPQVHRVVSYQDQEVHNGTIYKASGWTPTPAPNGGEWNNTNRRRIARRIKMKVRWERTL
jgi:hypothetical protein